MAKLILKTEDDFKDLVVGATFFGTGGGGTQEEGLRLLKKEADAGHTIECISPEEVPDDEWTVCLSFMGNRAPLSEEQKRKMGKLGLKTWKYENNLVEAAKLLEEYAKVKIGAIVVPELGGANTPGPLAAGINLGVKVVDGDYAGRAIPEIAQATPCLFGKSISPFASVDKWGNKTIICETVNNNLGERIGKMLAMSAFGNTGLAMFLLKAKDMKKYIIPGTLTESYELGKIIRNSKELGKNVIEEILEYTKGELLFTGEVANKEWAVEDGYYVGNHLFKGIGSFEGHEYKVWFKNENHISWYDNKDDVTSPDLICQLDMDDASPITNHDLRVGHKVALIGIKARSVHRLSNFIGLLDPKYYGFDISYVPMETRLIQNRRY